MIQLREGFNEVYSIGRQSAQRTLPLRHLPDGSQEWYVEAPALLEMHKPL
jgi:hypothetical protein